MKGEIGRVQRVSPKASFHDRPAGGYSEDEVKAKSDDVFRHVFRVYPTVPSPYYQIAAMASQLSGNMVRHA